ncbi:unnamed protein product [Brassicogethes aeneus]|uniref:Synaptic plasticity regulator PANTS n=1 Tax=Brassicogethes aeneus TaxID=1431903 RepID=A0A9P0B2W1_BRAAE|nr:unnamed protein product [Brassicogethes aeneus]
MSEEKKEDAKNSTENKDDKTKDTPERLKDDWMIRKCSLYDDEYSDCTSIKGRFNQYFIFGDPLDCTQWKIDSKNCYKYVDNNDFKAGEELIKSEKKRRLQRLLPHYANDVWERRKTPPEDWNKPLPEHMLKEYEATYLNVKSKELKGEIPPQFDTSFNGLSCVIL